MCKIIADVVKLTCWHESGCRFIKMCNGIWLMRQVAVQDNFIFNLKWNHACLGIKVLTPWELPADWSQWEVYIDPTRKVVRKDAYYEGADATFLEALFIIGSTNKCFMLSSNQKLCWKAVSGQRAKFLMSIVPQVELTTTFHNMICTLHSLHSLSLKGIYLN